VPIQTLQELADEVVEIGVCASLLIYFGNGMLYGCMVLTSKVSAYLGLGSVGHLLC
jgi:hypothetical protein